MKKINEIFSINNGFFTQLFTDDNEKYQELFDNFKPQNLNINFLSLCGERFCAPIVNVCGENMRTLTAIIINNYYQSWQRVKNALFAEYDPVKPSKITITTDKELQSDKSSNNENTENSYLYPFNENAESVNEGKNTAISTNTAANVERLSQTVTREGLSNVKPTDLISAEINTRKMTFLSLVLNDIKEFCTLQVYE